jgi:hypothetical protein
MCIYMIKYACIQKYIHKIDTYICVYTYEKCLNKINQNILNNTDIVRSGTANVPCSACHSAINFNLSYCCSHQF